jgi:hypothetical protein
MKNTKALNAALASVNGQDVSFKVTLNADEKGYSHTEIVQSAGGVHLMIRQYPSLAKGRIIVKAVANDQYFTKTVIFDGTIYQA